MRIFFEITRCRRGERVHTELISCACMRHRAINSRHRNGGKVCSKRRRITPINYEAARRETRDRKRERGRRKCKFRSRRSVVGEERRRCRASPCDCGEGIRASETISPRRGEVLLL